MKSLLSSSMLLLTVVVVVVVVIIIIIVVVLTHGLVACRYGRWMVKHEDLSLELPAGLRPQLGRHHHHAFPDLGPLHLRPRHGVKASRARSPEGHKVRPEQRLVRKA